jgi:hypothetical protein
MAVVSVTEDQIPDQIGNLQDVFSIKFTIADKPGTFSVQVPQAGDPVAAAHDAIAALTAKVEGIYGA